MSYYRLDGFLRNFVFLLAKKWNLDDNCKKYSTFNILYFNLLFIIYFSTYCINILYISAYYRNSQLNPQSTYCSVNEISKSFAKHVQYIHNKIQMLP